MSEIPVQNVFYLLSYALDDYESGSRLDVSELEADHTSDLLAHLLIEATNRLLRRRLDRGYRTERREVAGVRGQIDFNASLSRLLLPQGRAACRVDKLTNDVLHNRLLKAALERLAATREIDTDLREKLARLADQFRNVGEIELRTKHFSRLQLDRNARSYRLAMDLCRLVAASAFIDESTGETRFRDFLKDEARMNQIFEKFVLNFYDRELDGLRASAPTIDWNASAADERSPSMLPRMETDIVLEGDGRVLIIDTKFYQHTLQSGPFGDGESVYSKHLYQLYAYMQNYPADDLAEPVGGMLLYPTVDRSLELAYEIDGHRVRICTVNLGQDWKGIRGRLVELTKQTAES